MKQKDRNAPTHEGFFWARSKSFEWWNLIVRVYGDSPFFRIDSWDVSTAHIVENEHLYNIEQFGPEIEHPIL